MSQLNPVHNLTNYFIKIHLINIFAPSPGSHMVSSLQCLPLKHWIPPMRAVRPTHTSHHPWFYHYSLEIGYSLKSSQHNMKLLIMQFLNPICAGITGGESLRGIPTLWVHIQLGNHERESSVGNDFITKPVMRETVSKDLCPQTTLDITGIILKGKRSNYGYSARIVTLFQSPLITYHI
jgi:hypothetical protein